jgi:hypothetical protein
MEQKVMNLAERIAALEARAEQGALDREEIKDTLGILAQTLAELVNKVSKWEGKFGGVLFAIGCLWAFFSGFAKAIVAWVQAFGSVGK